MSQVRLLQAALARAQAVDSCAEQGCQLVSADHALRARADADGSAHAVPWRGEDWDHPAVQTLRAAVTGHADELDRLRAENALLRRWVGDHLDIGEPGE